MPIMNQHNEINGLFYAFQSVGTNQIYFNTYNLLPSQFTIELCPCRVSLVLNCCNQEQSQIPEEPGANHPLFLGV